MQLAKPADAFITAVRADFQLVLTAALAYFTKILSKVGMISLVSLLLLRFRATCDCKQNAGFPQWIF